MKASSSIDTGLEMTRSDLVD